MASDLWVHLRDPPSGATSRSSSVEIGAGRCMVGFAAIYSLGKKRNEEPGPFHDEQQQQRQQQQRQQQQQRPGPFHDEQQQQRQQQQQLQRRRTGSSGVLEPVVRTGSSGVIEPVCG